MAARPDVTKVTAYLADAGLDAPETAVTDALAAEADDQARRCRIPADVDAFPPALAEALCRRVAHNLAVRALPLGVQPIITDGAAVGANVGGYDAEVRRLEAPYRKLVIG